MGTKISSLPCTISAPGFYYLGANFTYTGVNPAISVNSDGATIDLMGFRITGNGTNKGIYLSGRKNVEIRNGTLQNFTYGIHEDSDAGVRHRVINVRVEGNNNQSNSYGIQLAGNAHLVKGCTLSASRFGVEIVNGTGTVSGCLIEGCKFGISNSNSGNIIGNFVLVGDLQSGILGGDLMLDQNTVSGTGIHYDVFGSGAQWGTNVGVL